MDETPEVKALIDDLIKSSNEADAKAVATSRKSGIMSLFTLGATQNNTEDNINVRNHSYRREISLLINKIYNNEKKYSIDEVMIYTKICKSEKLGTLPKELQEKIICNIPIGEYDKYTVFALARNKKLGNLVDYYPLLKCKVLQCHDCCENILRSFNSNLSLNEELSKKDPVELQAKTIEIAFSILETDEVRKYAPLFIMWRDNKEMFKDIVTIFSSEEKTSSRKKILDAISNAKHEFNNNQYHNEIKRCIGYQDKQDWDIFIKNLEDTSNKLLTIPDTLLNIEQKIVKALDFCATYETRVNTAKEDIHKKHSQSNEKILDTYKKAKDEHEIYLTRRNEKKQLGEDLKNINKTIELSGARLAELQEKLTPLYNGSDLAQVAVDNLPTASYSVTEMAIPMFATGMMINPIFTAMVAGGAFFIATKVKKAIEKQDLKNRMQQTKDDMSVISENTKPAPKLGQFTNPVLTEIAEAVAKVETPLATITPIMQELTSDNIGSVSSATLERLLCVNTFIALHDNFDINNRFKPIVQLMGVMPDAQFAPTGIINHDKISSLTELIKNALDLKRGDIATDLIQNSIPKIKDNNFNFILGVDEISEQFRQELSNITEKSIELSGQNTTVETVDKRKPLYKMWELARQSNIPEYSSDDPEEPNDIPVSGHLPEIIDNALNDLRKNEPSSLNALIQSAIDSQSNHIIAGNDIFNGRDKKILSLMIDKVKRAINPNPLNEMMADFLTLYTAGHFAEGGGFSDTPHNNNNDDEQLLLESIKVVPLRVLERLVTVVNSQTHDNENPTILELLEDKPAQVSEITGVPYNKCDFKKAHRQENGDINRMKIRFNALPTKPFNTSVTFGNSKHRIGIG